MTNINKITRIGKQTWKLECFNGETFDCKEWFEKKTGKWHVKLPADNPSGRTYIRVDKIIGDEFEFETKTEHREGLGWKDRMTDEEKKQWQACEETMAKIKKACEERQPEKLEKNSEEWLLAEIAKLTAKLEAKRQ